jgi:hypothetical protein
LYRLAPYRYVLRTEDIFFATIRRFHSYTDSKPLLLKIPWLSPHDPHRPWPLNGAAFLVEGATELLLAATGKL